MSVKLNWICYKYSTQRLPFINKCVGAVASPNLNVLKLKYVELIKSIFDIKHIQKHRLFYPFFISYKNRGSHNNFAIFFFFFCYKIITDWSVVMMFKIFCFCHNAQQMTEQTFYLYSHSYYRIQQPNRDDVPP